MVRMLRHLRLAALLLACSCTHNLNAQSYRTVDDVVANATDLVGKPTTVRGYLRFGDDSRNLWSSREAFQQVRDSDVQPDDPAWDRCITLFNIEHFRDALLARNNSYVLITGLIQRVVPVEGEITTSSCNTLGISVLQLR